MKRLITTTALSFIATVVLLIGLQGCTTITTESKPVSKVVNVDGATKDVLYVRANNWMVSAFKNAESVIQFSDKESGTVSGKYYLAKIYEGNQYGPAQLAFALIKIETRDGGARITITPDSFSYMKGDPYALYSQEQAKVDIDRLMGDFELAMLQEEEAW